MRRSASPHQRRRRYHALTSRPDRTIFLVRSEDLEELLPLSRLRKGAGETASLRRNGKFERFPAPLGKLAARVAAHSMTSELSSRKRVLNPPKIIRETPRIESLDVFRRHGNDVQSLRRTIGQCAHRGAAGGVRGKFDAGLLLALARIAAFAAARRWPDVRF